jgi:hypothetical protein
MEVAMVRTGVSCAGGSETVQRISLRDGVHLSRLKKADDSDGTSERREIDKRDDNVLSRVRKVPAKVIDRVSRFLGGGCRLCLTE